jgi:hypothetical protein
MAVTSAEAIITRTYSFRIKIPDIKMMRILRNNLPGGIIDLQLYANEAGRPVEISNSAVDNNTWLQLTSIAPQDENRKVAVQITSGNVPLGTLLMLSASDCDTGDGARGTTHPISNLSKSTAQTLIDGIGSCYTGTTSTSGYNLTYTWMPDPANIEKMVAFSSYQIQVTFTMSSY